MKYPNLFSPIQIGSLKIKNRIEATRLVFRIILWRVIILRIPLTATN